MRSDDAVGAIAVFDLGGTWFRWGRYTLSLGLLEFQRAPAISYMSHPQLSAEELQWAMSDFVIQRAHDMRRAGPGDLRMASVSVGAVMNAFDETILGSGPLWGPTAKPFRLHSRLVQAMPELEWQVINDITALLAPYMEDGTAFRKTLLLTISTGIGCRLYDHQTHRIPYDLRHGIQGEIGHLVVTFELDGKAVHRKCECGGSDHLNAFSSGRGIARTLQDLPRFESTYSTIFSEPSMLWAQADDDYRLSAFKTQLDCSNSAACMLLDACVTPVSRTLATALSVDPQIDRIVITGGVAQGLGAHYRRSLARTFERDGLYQITERDPQYLTSRLQWEEPDDSGGLRGAGIYAKLNSRSTSHPRS